jgi:phage baseplate assembly protein W
MTTLDNTLLGTDVRLEPGGEIKLTPSGDLQTVSGMANLELAMLRRTTASPGDMTHRPEYGDGILDYLEGANRPANRARMAAQIRRSSLRDTRISAIDVSVQRGGPSAATEDDASMVTITKTVTVRHNGSQQQVSTTLRG